MDETIATVAEATAECGMQSWLANYFPASKHAELREYLHDLAVGALHAFIAVRAFTDVPEPSAN